MTNVFNSMTQFTDLSKVPAVQMNTSSPVSDKESLSAVKVDVPVNSDTVELSNSKEKKAKKLGPIKALKNTIANIKKFADTTKARL